MLEVTEKQQRTYDIRHSADPPISFREMAAMLGTGQSTVKRNYDRALKKLGPPEGLTERPKLKGTGPNHPGRPQARHRGGEKKHPDKAAEAITKAANPLYDNITQIARDLDMPTATVQKLVKRLETQFLPVLSRVEDVQNQDLERLWGSLSKTILENITLDDIKKASLAQKGILAGIATDKLLVLRGQPTQIIRTEGERQSIRELVAAFHAEAERRGEIIDVDPISGATRLVPADTPPT